MKKNYLVLSLVFVFVFLNADFSGDTLIQTTDGPVALQDLQIGDMVICYNEFAFFESPIRFIQEKIVHEVVVITTEHDDVISTSRNSYFYLPDANQWLPAKELAIGDQLLQQNMKEVAIRDIQIKREPTRLFSISVEKYHNFFITEHGILVHNMGGFIFDAIGRGLVALGSLAAEAATVLTTQKSREEIVESLGYDPYVPQIPGNIGDRMIVEGRTFEYTSEGWKIVLEEELKKVEKPIDYTVPQVYGEPGWRMTLYGKEFIYTETGWQLVELLPVETIQRSEKKLFDKQCALQEEAKQPPAVDDFVVVGEAGMTQNGIWCNVGDKLLRRGVTLNEDGHHIDWYEPNVSIDDKKIDWQRKEKANDKNEKKSGKTIEDILEGAKPGKNTHGPSRIYGKPGSFDDANNDFNDLGLTGVVDLGGGKRAGTLPDGRTVVVRPGSAGKRDQETGKTNGDGPPTLEIQGQSSNGDIKIRYELKD